MSLPVGVTTATVTAGAPVSFTGTALQLSIRIRPSIFLVHTESGTPLVDIIEKDEGTTASFSLPYTDQAGFQDENGNQYLNWSYVAEIQYSSSTTTLPIKTKVFQLPTGVTPVDLDTLPSGTTIAPGVPIDPLWYSYVDDLAAAAQDAQLAAEAAADSIGPAVIAAETAAAYSEAAANGFDIGTVANTAPGSPATATITGVAPARKLNLVLPQGILGPVGPANTLTVVDTVTGPETAGATGAQGLKGDKGDPGGFVVGTGLGSNNLNTIIAPGFYTQTTGSNVTVANNYPYTTGVTALLTVTAVNSSNVIQRIEWGVTTVGGKVFWERVTYDSGATWTTWRAFNSTRTDQTAGRAIYQWDDLNNREQLIYGDTGLRDISADSAWIAALTGTGVTLANNLIKVRRVGSVVDLSWVVDKPASGNVTCSAALPAGFRPAGIWNAIGINSSIGLIRAYSAGGANTMIYQSNAAGMNTTHNIVYTTTDAWPTTLPGTASGSIPNL